MNSSTQINICPATKRTNGIKCSNPSHQSYFPYCGVHASHCIEILKEKQKDEENKYVEITNQLGDINKQITKINENIKETKEDITGVKENVEMTIQHATNEITFVHCRMDGYDNTQSRIEEGIKSLCHLTQKLYNHTCKNKNKNKNRDSIKLLEFTESNLEKRKENKLIESKRQRENLIQLKRYNLK